MAQQHTTYIIKGKLWKRSLIKMTLISEGHISSKLTPFELRVNIRNLGELMLLQRLCKELELKYEQQ